MTTEEEFFEAFKPKYIYQYRVYMEQDNGQVIKYYWGKELLINVFSDKTYKKREHIKELKVCEVIRHNPPITPEIVLKLIKILLKSSNEFHINISKGEYGCDQGFIGGFYQQTFEQSILSLCIEAKDEIQDQVRGLFNDN